MPEYPSDKDDIFLGILYGYSTCRDLIWNIFESINLKENEFAGNLYNLIKFISERSTTISLLIQNDLLWDAQIMMRPIQEATMKVSFLCNCNEVEQQERLREFLYELEEIHSLKQSHIAKTIVKSFKDNELMQLPFLPLILDLSKENTLQAKWPAKKRKALQQKWSYSEMMREQSKKFNEIETSFLSLAHPYKMSSHLIHVDETGIGIIAERANRTEIEKEKIQTAHFCGLLSDSLNYFILCGYSLCFAFKKVPKPFNNILRELKPIFEKMDELQSRVYEDPDYDKYRK